ncbi:MAG: alpha/beta hydrolase [Anaerolineaceae bacterium]
MQTNVRKQAIWLIVLVLIISFSVVMSYTIERDFGNVSVNTIKIVADDGYILTAKLYRPKSATSENPLPAVLNLHGYQNDKDVNETFSIELARRGFVVLAPDSLGHGDSQGGLNNMGWFADPTYAMGNEDALAYLIELPFVNSSQIGVMGHSMGGMTTVKLPALFPDNVKAVIQIASSAGSPELPNLLMLQARYDEFVGFRENQLRTEELNSSETRLAALGLSGAVEWNTTYGSFESGTARRMAFINMDHHLLPLTNNAVAEAVDWMRLALKGDVKDSLWIEPASQIFMYKEIFGLVTLMGTLISLIPLTNLLLSTKYFAPVAQPIPNRYTAKKGAWWRMAVINALIGGILYPLTTQYGGIMTKIETWLPFMKMEMGNGVAFFYLANAVVAIALFFLWFRKSKKTGVTMYDMGVSFDKEKTKIDWKIIGKTILIGVILFMWMYLLEGFFQWALGQEFRFSWPYMRQFSSATRVGYFFLYLIPTLLFFLINGGIFLFGQARQKEYSTPAKTQWMWWLKNCFAMVTGLLLVWAFQYLPWLLGGAGPGFEIVGLSQFSGMWPLMLIVYIPEFIILFWFLTWFYRRTGRIYLGSLMVASIATWFLAAGSIIIQ